VIFVTARNAGTNDLKLCAFGTKRSSRNVRSGEAMSAAVARALKSGNLWLTLGYFFLLLLLMKAYA
jgi:hypothetical protein